MWRLIESEYGTLGAKDFSPEALHFTALQPTHDVTKIQTTKQSILLRFYFHDVLEQLKTNVHTNFRLKMFLVLC